MAKEKRKDKKRVVLRTGELQRTDGSYQFTWMDENKKRRYVYSRNLDDLREKEKQIAESLRKNTSGLSAEQMQRLGDIAYGMLLTKELAQPEKKEA